MEFFDEIEIMNILNEISNKLTYITERLEYIENDIKDIKKSSNNMDEHISFVENVYDTVKIPFYYIINKITRNNVTDIPSKQIKNE
jgi:archaellum component FlaC